MTSPNNLYIVEYEDGEKLDFEGEGGFSVFTSFSEALDAADTMADVDPKNPLVIVKFSREDRK